MKSEDEIRGIVEKLENEIETTFPDYARKRKISHEVRVLKWVLEDEE